MIVLTAVLLVLLLIFGPIIFWVNKKAIEKYDRPAIGLMQSIYVAVSFVIFCVGIGNLPKEFELSHQEPMSAEEIELAKAAWAADTAGAEQGLAAAKERLQSATDALDKKDAAERTKEAELVLKRYKTGTPSTIKTVWTPKVLLKFLSFPIAHSLESSAWCFGISLAVVLVIFVANGIQMDWLTATVVLILQVALSIPLLLLAFVAAKAFQNAQRGKPMLGS